nr:stage V sporulation protein E-like [Nerophis lumbriciformis]
MVYSATAVLAQSKGYNLNLYFLKQVLAAVVGLAAMLAVMHVDYRVLKRPVVAYVLVGGALALLVAVLFAPALNNSRRWFYLGGLSIQPSELAKLALVVYIAYQIDRKRDFGQSYAFLVPAAVMTALMASLILLGRDLGTTVLLVVPAVLMIFLAGVSWRYLAIGGLITLPLAAVGVLIEPYRFKRLTAFMDPQADPLGSGFQLLQSLIAIGSGGVFGLGPGQSLQKLYFLPSPHADFIYAIVAEELGFIGAVAVLALVAVLLWRGVLAGLQAPDLFGRYLAWGLTGLLVIQSMIHISVALGLLPSTGVPLPFISHGGSSLVTSLVACGLVLNVSQHG